MAKRSAKKKSNYQLTTAGKARFNKYMSQIRQGIENVCEIHKHEKNASMSQSEFEKAYIDKLLATPISAISATLRTLMEALTKQKEAELQALNKDNKTPTKGTEE
ncbi:MAG: hypothetical protein K2L70_06715 [Clostridia bacterium]|nr:hypothetical protein [Clostridia bacterium]